MFDTTRETNFNAAKTFELEKSLEIPQNSARTGGGDERRFFVVASFEKIEEKFNVVEENTGFFVIGRLTIGLVVVVLFV